MKKTNFLKIVMTLFMAFVVTGAFAQTNTGQWGTTDPAGDYSRSAAAPIALPDAVTYTDYVTIGQPMPFFVWPSAAYNPDWDPTGLSTGFTTEGEITTNVVSDFDWKSGVFNTDNATTEADFTAAAAIGGFPDNYVEVTFATTGEKLIQVTETPVSGACVAEPVYFGLTVIDEPSVTITSAADLGLTRVITSSCWAIAGDNETAIPFVINNADEVYPYHFSLTYNIYNVDGLDGSGNLPADGSGDLNAGDGSVTGIADDGKILGQDGASTPSAANPISVAGGTNLLAGATDFEVQNNKITVYEFDLAGYNAKISRKSDYVSIRDALAPADNPALYENYSVYGTANKFYVVALPAPVTGPIYHIDNTWGL